MRRGALSISDDEREFMAFLAQLDGDGGTPMAKSTGSRRRLSKTLVVFPSALAKGSVKSHPRRLKSGKVINVRQHNRKGGDGARDKGNAKEPQFTPLAEPTVEQHPPRKLIDYGMRLGAKAHEIAEKYFMDRDEFLALWTLQVHPQHQKYGHWQNEVAGDKVYAEIHEAIGEFGERPWNSNEFEQSFWAAFRGIEKLLYVRGWRYGEISNRGYSHNYRDDYPEAGLSLMAVTERADGGEIPRGPTDEVSQMFIAASGEDVVWADGWLIPRRGTDGEPLVIGARKAEPAP